MAAKRKKSGSTNGFLYLLIWLTLVAGWLSMVSAKWANAPEVNEADLIILYAVTALCVFFYLVFRLSGYQGDGELPALVLMIGGIGFILQFRLGTLNLLDYSRAANTAYPLGWAAFFIVWMLFRRGRYAVLSGWGLPSLLLSSAVLALIVLTGERFRGAMYIAGQVNPAEIVKLLLAVFMAVVLTDYRKPLQQAVAGIPAPPVRSVMSIGILWAIPMALLVMQRDLGMIILLNTVFLILIFLATGRWGYLVLGGAAAAAVGYAGFHLFYHARERLFAWQDPFVDPTGKGWQILQSLSAMFTGGMTGRGLGAGSPALVPIAESDFIYAVFAEEAGFIGCILLMLAYLMMFHRGYRIADQNKAPFAQTLAAGLTTMLALQTIMNIGGVTKAIPLTGITLPLISHGGSSLVTTLAMLGLLLALSEPSGKSAKR